MVRRIAARPRARRDLIEIWLYTFGRWSETQADQYVHQIDEAIQTVAGNPQIGVDYSHVGPGIRRYAVMKHRIFYRSAGDQIEILRILHERMDAPAHELGDEDEEEA